MRWLVLLPLLAGCPKKGPPGPNTPAHETWFVQASSLNVRDNPFPGAERVCVLTIGAPVRVLEEQGDWTRVGAECDGWVASKYVGPSRPTVEGVVAQITDARDAGDAGAEAAAVARLEGLLGGRLRLEWVGFCDASGDASAPIPVDEDACESLDPAHFDPFGLNMDGPSVDALGVLAQVPDRDGLEVRVDWDIGVPTCTECDSGCYEEAGREAQTETHGLSGGRYLVDLSSGRDFTYTDVHLEASLILDGQVVRSVAIELEGWPWCM